MSLASSLRVLSFDAVILSFTIILYSASTENGFLALTGAQGVKMSCVRPSVRHIIQKNIENDFYQHSKAPRGVLRKAGKQAQAS